MGNSVGAAPRGRPSNTQGAHRGAPLLISFEGAEGSGKSTQIRFAVNFLRRKGYSVVLFREPGGTPVGEAIRKVLLDPRNKKMTVETELLLYLAARAQLVREKIEPALRQGKVVVLDRFEDSTLAYQGFGGGIPLEDIKRLSRLVRGGLKPHVTFLLDVETQEGLRRSGRRDRVEKKSFSFHRRVRKGFLTLARREPKRFVVISARDSIQQARKKIEGKLETVFARPRSGRSNLRPGARLRNLRARRLPCLPAGRLRRSAERRRNSSQ